MIPIGDVPVIREFEGLKQLYGMFSKRIAASALDLHNDTGLNLVYGSHMSVVVPHVATALVA